MSQEAPRLRAALLEKPDDADRWKVYADYLEENSDSACEGVREFTQCLENEEGEIARYIHLASSAEASRDSGHRKFCRQITRAATSKVKEAVTNLLDNYGLDLLDSDEFSCAVDSTNAHGWTLDEIAIDSIEWLEDACVVHVSYTASGQQDEQQPFDGNIITGTANAMIDTGENVTFEEIIAEVRLDEEEDELDEEDEPGEDGEWE